MNGLSCKDTRAPARALMRKELLARRWPAVRHRLIMAKTSQQLIRLLGYHCQNVAANGCRKFVPGDYDHRRSLSMSDKQRTAGRVVRFAPRQLARFPHQPGPFPPGAFIPAQLRAPRPWKVVLQDTATA